ncbi:MAG TPA: homoserine kinase [Gemmatimonadales bacterium]
MPRQAAVRVPASSANLGPGFDVLALALDLHLEVRAKEAPRTQARLEFGWEGEGANEVPRTSRNLIMRAAQEPFQSWDRPLRGLALEVKNEIPIGRGLGSSAAAIIAGISIGARLRGLRLSPARVLELGLPLEGHGDNLAAALYGGFCVVATGGGAARVLRLTWPTRWKAVVFVPEGVSPTHEARRLVPTQVPRADVVHNLSRLAEWVLAVSTGNRALVATAMEDRLHQPARARAYPYLYDMINSAREAGGLGAALSGAGGSVIAITDRKHDAVAESMSRTARDHHVAGRILRIRASSGGLQVLRR